jgi:predicted Zn-dependent peptidase
MPTTFKQHVLDNGLQILAEVDPSAHTAAIGFFVKTGARDEAGAAMGVSHYLEHMMFKGTETRTALDVDRDFDTIGAVHNAFTTAELTAFWSHCLPERLPEAETILSDILRPSLRTDDFDDEKSVILEEIAMYADHPFWVLYERTMEAYYGVHPLSHRVLGTPETITALQRDDMAEYFEDRYSADNTVVALAGKVDMDEMVARLTEHCGHWQRTNTARDYPDIRIEPGDFTIASATANRHYVLMMSPGPDLEDDRRYAADMLAQILGDSDGSRLYWALIETGLAEDAQSQYDGRDGTGEYLVYCSCSPEDADRVETVVRSELDGLVASLTEDDLVRVRSKVATGATLHGELPAGRMRRLGQVWTYTGVYRSLEEELDRINAVSLDDLRSVAAELPIAPTVVGRLTPET